jgi:hypothetical protein
MRIDVSLYEEVEADTSANWQAMGVVVLSSAAAGIGIGLPEGLFGLIGGSVAALIGWVVWAGVTHFIGTRILPTADTDSSWGQVLRTTGFSTAPGFFRVFALVPFLGLLIDFFVLVWMLVAFVVAVRQALDYKNTWRAVAVCLTGWLAYVLLGFLLVPSAA